MGVVVVDALREMHATPRPREHLPHPISQPTGRVTLTHTRPGVFRLVAGGGLAQPSETP